MYKQLTPVLIVDAIEPVLPLWDALGFKRTAEVPHEDRLGFVILTADSIEVMYQTRASAGADVPAATAAGTSCLFITVDALDAVEPLLPAATEVIERRRKTFYGSTETIVRDAAGNIVTFAQMSS
jgi:uncharacterized glyoxalase superfamily protein PhnB